MKHWEKKQYSSYESYRESRERYNALRRERRRALRQLKGPQCKEIHCLFCGKTAVFGNQPHIAFCSDECANAWKKKITKVPIDNILKGDLIRQFPCRVCGKQVRVFDTRDHRTTFCSESCRNKWFRIESARQKGKGRRGDNLGMSGGMSLGSLIRREAMDLR